MYQAKRSGQRLATYDPDRDTANMDRLTLTGQLRRAVAHNEFRLAFQPIVDLASGAVVAAEALARWQHPQRGELDPRWFLETLERSEQLSGFTAAMLDQALAAAAGWAAAGHDLTVSVNISPRSLLDHTFPRQVAAALAAHRVTPARLCLELTETLAVSQVEVVDRVLGHVRRLGVRLALDDFGTGFSSLAVLSRIPVHQLKIDRAFVRDMHTLDRAAAVVRSTVDMARGLALDVVAEGVETETQRRTLWELGCAAGQGHLFGRPMPPQRFADALARGYGDAPGVLAPPLHDAATVLRLPRQRRAAAEPARRLP
jgi:EAL domain-containing protein (putative c-di-GMP-specific phosphodiesterase class I)